MRGKTARIFLILLLICVGAGIVVGLFGLVQGEEFCPQKFTMQRFSYYQIPFAKIQITPVTFSPSSRGNAALSRHLRTKKLLGSVSSQLRWDIVSMGDLTLDSNRGDADILVKYLEQPGAFGSENWLDWTKNAEHQDVAALLWPLIAQLAEEQLYILVPDIFDAARAAESAADFTARVQSIMPPSVQKLATAEGQRGNQERAQQLERVARDLASFPSTIETAFIEDDVGSDEEPQDVAAEADPETTDIE